MTPVDMYDMGMIQGIVIGVVIVLLPVVLHVLTRRKK